MSQSGIGCSDASAIESGTVPSRNRSGGIPWGSSVVIRFCGALPDAPARFLRHFLAKCSVEPQV